MYLKTYLPPLRLWIRLSHLGMRDIHIGEENLINLPVQRRSTIFLFLLPRVKYLSCHVCFSTVSIMSDRTQRVCSISSQSMFWAWKHHFHHYDKLIKSVLSPSQHQSHSPISHELDLLRSIADPSPKDHTKLLPKSQRWAVFCRRQWPLIRWVVMPLHQGSGALGLERSARRGSRLSPTS